MTQETIVAIATPSGAGAIGVIRLSGPKAISATQAVFKGKDLSTVKTHTVHFGHIMDGDATVDEVVVTVFKGPRSYTKEDVIEISCHGSDYILKKVVQILLKQGVRLAKAGEFTQRAFLNGRFDLAQAEAVADLIASDNATAHQAAMNQMRGGFSEEIKHLRAELIHFASMVELELDFGEEDVEFADRDQLKELIYRLLRPINRLISSFDMGNVIKNGIPTVIAGKPNAGKSTLLNALLNEEKAIVSNIPGTTRDFIEDEINIEGIKFRFIDTAGLRESTDEIEKLGVARTKEKMAKASMIIYLFDASQTAGADQGLPELVNTIKEEIKLVEDSGVPFIVVGNKVDQQADKNIFSTLPYPVTFISASTHEGLDALKDQLLEAVNAGEFKKGDTMVTNLRHFEGLNLTKGALEKVLEGIDGGITGDFLAMDIRQALHYLGEITGEITTEDLLDNIFSKFCIGK